MRKVLSALLVAGLASLLCSCMTFELEGDGAQDSYSKNDSETVHGSIYSFKWKKRNIEKCENGQGIYKVEFHTNAGFLLVSVLSLGLYVPQTVEWWCQAPEAGDGPIFEGGSEGQSGFISPGAVGGFNS